MTSVGDDRQRLRAVVEALNDPHFRKQRTLGPSVTDLNQIVGRAFENKEPIELVGLMFTRKNVNPLKRGPGDESMIDLAEIISLIHINSFAAFVADVHPYGARFTILSEGTRFLKAFHLSEKSVRVYQTRIRDWIHRLNLTHIRLLDYEDTVRNALSAADIRHREEAYKKARILYEEAVGAHLDTKDMSSTLALAIQRDPVKDAANPRNNFVPLWDSIKHSIPYPFLEQAAGVHEVSYELFYKHMFTSLLQPQQDPSIEALRERIIRHSWESAIEHNARIMGDIDAHIDVASLIHRSAIRTTINPRSSSPHLGIYSVRETLSRVQPWHGTAYLKLDGTGKVKTTVLTKLELESIGALPVNVKTSYGDINFYASPDACALLRESDQFRFNMTTKS